MINLKRILVIAISCFLFVFSYAQEQQFKNSKSDSEILEAWQQFLSAITTNDKAMLTKLSTSTIKCYDCIENTDKEKKAMNQMRAKDFTWYERIYDDMIYVPILDFIAEDFDLRMT